jgi:hypothetical protein
MKIEEFFDPYNPEHIDAFATLSETGSWPEGFADHCRFDPCWLVALLGKLSQAWVDAVTDGRVRYPNHGD